MKDELDKIFVDEHKDKKIYQKQIREMRKEINKLKNTKAKKFHIKQKKLEKKIRDLESVIKDYRHYYIESQKLVNKLVKL